MGIEMKSAIIKTFAISVALTALCGTGLHASAAERPNILLITVDDMNYDSPGCFGGPKDLTPNIDRLASEGMRFERAHVTFAICQPSRQALMTGRYPHNAGFRWFEPVADGVPLLPEILHEHGYLNACFGKAEHLQPRARYRWEESLDIGEIRYGRNPAEYYRLCRAFIEKADSAGRPFFIMANSHDPHRPFHGSSEEEKELAWARKQGGTIALPSRVYEPAEALDLGFLPPTPEVRKQTAQYMSSCRRADDTVGEILRALEETGQRENTLVVFLSDNGMPFPFAKGCVYLNSTRTPFIVRWPGRVRPDSVNQSDFINGVDFMPTVLEALGLAIPPGTDGRSFLPLLEGGKQHDRDSTVTVFYKTFPTQPVNRPEQVLWYQMRALHQGRYGYIYNGWAHGKRNFGVKGIPEILDEMKRTGHAERVEFFRNRVPEELYDFDADPDGLVNLAGDPTRRQLLENMRAGLLAWMKTHRDTDLLPEYETVVRDGGVTAQTPLGKGYKPAPAPQLLLEGGKSR
jgi:N-sulfoglucosamine sulfohydrolase